MSYIVEGAVLSYPQLFVPKLPMDAKPGQKARYSAMLLIPQSLDINALQQICYNLLREKWGDKTDDLLAAGQRREPNGLKWPFRKDNLKRDGSKRFDETLYKCFIACWSESQPGLVDRYAGPDGKPLKILQPRQDKFYAGCVVNASLNPYLYDNQGNRGVGLGLVNLQFWADGTRLDNRVAAEDEFKAEARPTADLSSMGDNVVPGPGAGGAAPGAAGPRGAGLNDLFA